MAVTATYRPPEQKLTGKTRVFEATEENAAQVLASWCDGIESRNWNGRFEDLTFFRYMTGRPALFSYNLSSIARPAAVNKYQRATYTRPVKNIIGQCYETLNNRVFKNRPALMVCPDAGDYDEQFVAIDQTRYLDAAFADGMWPLVEEAAQDGSCWGSGFTLVDASHDGKSIRKKTVKKDEIIVDPAEAASDNVSQIAIRTFENRYTLLAAFGDSEEAVAAINAAPKAQLGFYWDNDLDTSDIVVLREYWHLDPNGKTGVHILATNNYCFKFEKYERDHFPLAKFIFHRLGFFGKGGVEGSLGLQREHNRMSLAMWENFRRIAYPRWFIPAGQGINEGELNDKSAGFVHYKDRPPEAAVAQAASAEQFNYIQGLERGIKEMWRVSDQAAAALPLPGGNSGRARLVQDQLDDRAHVDLLQHLEDYVTDLGYLLIEAADKVKPTFIDGTGRRQAVLKYPGFKGKRKLRAFPLSNIPQSIAGRQDWIDKAFAEGRINKETKTRLENLPDIDGEVDLQTASAMSVRRICFEMLKTGKYIPPNGFGDLDQQLGYVQSKALEEQNARPPAPPERLALLYRYAAALDDMISERDAAAPAPGPGFGVQPPQGVPGTPTGQAPAPGLPTKPPTSVVA